MNKIIQDIKNRQKPNDVIFTPKPVAELMIDLCDIKPNDKVLDPSRGGGIFFDILSSMCSLLTTLKDNEKTDKLIKEYNEVVKNNNKEKFYKIFDKEFIISDEARLIYLSCVCFRSMLNSRMPKTSKEGVINKCKKIEYYKKFAELFKKLTITNKDYKDILEHYKNDSNKFLYLDPPYVSKNPNEYGVNFTITDLIFIKKFMVQCKCKVMLHIDFTGYTYDLFKQYIKHYYSIRYGMSNKSKDIKDIYNKYHMFVCNY